MNLLIQAIRRACLAYVAVHWRLAFGQWPGRARLRRLWNEVTPIIRSDYPEHVKVGLIRLAILSERMRQIAEREPKHGPFTAAPQSHAPIIREMPEA